MASDKEGLHSTAFNSNDLPLYSGSALTEICCIARKAKIA